METQTQTSASASTLVQMRLQPKTMERIDELVRATGVTNRTQLVATCIEIAHVILTSTLAGSKIYIEKRDGKQEHLKIVGI